MPPQTIFVDCSPIGGTLKLEHTGAITVPASGYVEVDSRDIVTLAQLGCYVLQTTSPLFFNVFTPATPAELQAMQTQATQSKAPTPKPTTITLIPAMTPTPRVPETTAPATVTNPTPQPPTPDATPAPAVAYQPERQRSSMNHR